MLSSYCTTPLKLEFIHYSAEAPSFEAMRSDEHNMHMPRHLDASESKKVSKVIHLNTRYMVLVTSCGDTMDIVSFFKRLTV
jgi:hypothetical protein